MGDYPNPGPGNAKAVTLYGVNADGNLIPILIEDTGALAVQVTTEVDIDETGLATTAKQDDAIAQLTLAVARLTSLLALLPASLGQKAMAASLAVVIASDQSAVKAQGAAADAAAVSGNPILIAGTDGANVRTANIDSTGAIRLQSGGAAGSTAPTRVTQTGGVDGSGNLRANRVSAAGLELNIPAPGTSYSSTALEASAVISTTACSPARVSLLNAAAGNRFTQMFDATSLPANGAIPKDGGGAQAQNSRNSLIYPIPTNRFLTGLVVASSSTVATLTVSAADALIAVDLFASTN